MPTSCLPLPPAPFLLGKTQPPRREVCCTNFVRLALSISPCKEKPHSRNPPADFVRILCVRPLSDERRLCLHAPTNHARIWRHQFRASTSRPLLLGKTQPPKPHEVSCLAPHTRSSPEHKIRLANFVCNFGRFLLYLASCEASRGEAETRTKVALHQGLTLPKNCASSASRCLASGQLLERLEEAGQTIVQLQPYLPHRSAGKGCLTAGSEAPSPGVCLGAPWSRGLLCIHGSAPITANSAWALLSRSGFALSQCRASNAEEEPAMHCRSRQLVLMPLATVRHPQRRFADMSCMSSFLLALGRFPVGFAVFFSHVV